MAACGNGTAGAFAPRILQAIGCEVVPLDCELDHTFPRYNPNTEDMKMLHAMRDAVLANKADVALGFDGDGDRCGVVDNEGEEIFADKVGVMLARDMSTLHKGATFVVDVKSTGLFLTDPVLKANGVKADYWKTGHSYIKRRVNELGALAGFEKSGHFFFNKPYGRGYDDGMIFAFAVCDMLDRNPGKSMADLRKALPKTWGSPTMSPHCDDEKKYAVVDAVVKHFEAAKRRAINSPASRSAISSPSTACASPSRTAPGAWYAPRRTSQSWWWWWRVRCRRRACARCSRRSTACCARIQKWANIIRRFETRRGGWQCAFCKTHGPLWQPRCCWPCRPWRRPRRSSVVNVGAPAVNCVYNTSCTIVVSDTIGNIPLPGISGTTRLQSRTFTGATGAPAATKHEFEYRSDLTQAVGVGSIPCVSSLTFDFRPITKLPYIKGGPVADIYVVTSGGLGSVGIASADRVGNVTTIIFSKPICAGSSSAKGKTSYFFGLTAPTAPKMTTAQMQITGGALVNVPARVPTH